MGDNDPLSGPTAELGYLSLNAKLLSQSAGKLAADVGQVSRDVQHGIEVFTPILAELTGELKQLRLELHNAAGAASRSAWALVLVTAALVGATLIMAWPMWFPKAPVQSGPPPAVSSPAPRSN